MSNLLNIGLVGSGFMGQAHADAYRRAGILYRNLPCTPVLYAIADQNESLAEEARRKLGFAKGYGDWRRLVEDPEVHVVDITTPNHFACRCGSGRNRGGQTCLLRKADGGEG